MKINCKDCKLTCCNDMTIKLRKGKKGIVPDSLKPGTRLFVEGATWIKKTNKLWKCIAFDLKTRLCKIYRYRPPMCRRWQCPHAKKKKVNTIPVNAVEYNKDSDYILTFAMREDKL